MKNSGYRFLFIRSEERLTNILRVDHSTLRIVLVYHVLLWKLKMEIRPPLLISAKYWAVNIHAWAILSSLLVILFNLLSLLSFELFGSGPLSPVSVEHLHSLFLFIINWSKETLINNSQFIKNQNYHKINKFINKSLLTI